MIQSFIHAQKADTLLIVDDNEINREVLDHIFSVFYPTEHAENGKVGLDKILACPENYCAVLLDVVMPEVNGIQVLHRLHEEGLMEKIPVFLITAESANSTLKKAYSFVVYLPDLNNTAKVLEVFDEWGISQSEVQLQFEHVDALNEYHDIEIACNAYL